MNRTRRLARAAALRATAPVQRVRVARTTRAWRPFTRLLPVSDAPGWSIDHDMEELATTARRLGVLVAPGSWAPFVTGQSVFHGTQFALLRRDAWSHGNRYAIAYLHGRPGTTGEPFDECYEELGRLHARIDRVQVSHEEMRALVLSTGIDAAKVHLIRIGVNLDHFPLGDDDARRRARESLGLPRDAFVVGSFQKDGVGWRDGFEPKSIKGPDVLLAALERVRRDVPELAVLLSAPARGYVRAGLERLGIPYVHRVVKAYPEIATLYRALDAYLVSSRQEGGPKAVLEAMASGVPVVSTRVGQAAEIVVDGDNGWLADVEDAETLGARVAGVAELSASERARIEAAGRRTAEENSLLAQAPQWRALLDGFVAVPA